MKNVYEALDANRKKSWLILLVFNVFVIGTVWVVLNFLGYYQYGLVMAVVLAVISSGVNYFYGDKIVISSLRAKPVSKANYPQLVQAVENIAIATGLPMPNVYVIPSMGLNAMATGRDPKHASVLVTEGLLQRLNKSELEAVIAHEFGHIGNYDIRLMTLVSVAVGVITIFIDMARRGMIWGYGRDDDRDNRGGWLSILGLILIIFAPLIAQLIQLAISRSREFLADAYAAKVTKQPSALISALVKISQMPQVRQASLNTAHFFIASPFGASRNFLIKLFSTHPPVEERIKALQEMM